MKPTTVFKLILALLLAPMACLAQTQVDFQTQLKNNPTLTLSPSTAGLHWTDKLVTMYNSAACASGCTIVVPDSIADSGTATTPSIPGNVTVTFPGNATFTSCTINMGNFTQVYLNHATLAINGSNCTGLRQNTTVTMQTTKKSIISGGTINCNAQVACTGIYLGNHSNMEIDSVTITGATDTTSTVTTPTAGLVLYNTQFGHFRNINTYGNYVNGKIYAAPVTGGGSSNSFYDQKSTASTVGWIIANPGGSFPLGDIHFINPQFQSASVTGIAVFGVPSGIPTDVELLGGGPENTGGGASTVTIDGFLIKQSSIYANNSALFLNNYVISEASINPLFLLENGSKAVLNSLCCYGVAEGQMVKADATSHVVMLGEDGTQGTVTNVVGYPPNISGTLNTWLSGEPVLWYSSSVPNAYTGNPQTPIPSDINGASSTSTATDAQYGLVSTVTFGGSAGNKNTNRVNFASNFTTVGVTDVLAVVYMNPSVAANIACGMNFSDNFSYGNVALTANKWTRFVIYNGGIPNGTAMNLICYANDTAAATVKFMGVEYASQPQGTQGTGVFTQVLAGAVGSPVTKSIVANGQSGNTPAAILGGFEFATGRQGPGGTIPTGAVTSDIAMQWGGAGGGFRHWISTQHNNSFTSGNSISFYVNSATNPGDSTAPGTGNTFAMKLDNTGVVIPAGAVITNAPRLFSTLSACAAGTEGQNAAITDSTTNVWGATITGTGVNHVLAYCDGTNWTVAGK